MGGFDQAFQCVEIAVLPFEGDRVFGAGEEAIRELGRAFHDGSEEGRAAHDVNHLPAWDGGRFHVFDGAGAHGNG